MRGRKALEGEKKKKLPRLKREREKATAAPSCPKIK